MSGYSVKWWDSPEIIKTVLMQKKRGILRLLSVPVRYIKRKEKSIYKKLVKKEQKKTGNEVYNKKKLKKKISR